MKKILLSLLLLCGLTGSVSAQLLYKISGKDLSKPSYILGTHHLANLPFVNSLPGIMKAQENTDQVYGELKMDDASMQTYAVVMKEKSLLPDNKTIDQVLTAQEMERLNAFMMETMQTNFKNPAVMQQMGRLTPAYLGQSLTVLLYLTQHMGEFDPSQQVDAYFQKQALHNQLPVGALETIEDQVAVLFGDPMEKQVKALMCLVDNKEFYKQQLENLTKAYYAQDLGKLQAAADELMHNSCDYTPEDKDRLLYKRNAAWVPKMEQIMSATPTLFVVGALHLPGDKGVLALLQAAGYTVEGVR